MDVKRVVRSGISVLVSAALAVAFVPVAPGVGGTAEATTSQTSTYRAATKVVDVDSYAELKSALEGAESGTVVKVTDDIEVVDDTAAEESQYTDAAAFAENGTIKIATSGLVVLDMSGAENRSIRVSVKGGDELFDVSGSADFRIVHGNIHFKNHGVSVSDADDVDPALVRVRGGASFTSYRTVFSYNQDSRIEPGVGVLDEEKLSGTRGTVLYADTTGKVRSHGSRFVNYSELSEQKENPDTGEMVWSPTGKSLGTAVDLRNVERNGFLATGGPLVDQSDADGVENGETYFCSNGPVANVAPGKTMALLNAVLRTKATWNGNNPDDPLPFVTTSGNPADLTLSNLQYARYGNSTKSNVTATYERVTVNEGERGDWREWETVPSEEDLETQASAFSDNDAKELSLASGYRRMAFRYSGTASSNLQLDLAVASGTYGHVTLNNQTLSYGSKDLGGNLESHTPKVRTERVDDDGDVWHACTECGIEYREDYAEERSMANTRVVLEYETFVANGSTAQFVYPGNSRDGRGYAVVYDTDEEGHYDELVEGVTFEVDAANSVQSATAVGNYRVRLTGLQNYSGSKDFTWKVVAAGSDEAAAAEFERLVGAWANRDFRYLDETSETGDYIQLELPWGTEAEDGDQDAVASAQKAFAELTPAQQALVRDVVKARLDSAPVEIVADMIGNIDEDTDERLLDEGEDAMDEEEFEEACEEIEDAVGAYNKLTDAQRALFENEGDEADADLVGAKRDLDGYAAALASRLARALPEKEDVADPEKTDDETAAQLDEDLDEVEGLLDSLSSANRAKEGETQGIVDELRAALVERVAARIPDPLSEPPTEEEVAAVEAAWTAYNALTEKQQELVSEDAMKRMNSLPYLRVQSLIDSIPNPAGADDAAAVQKAREAYDALDADSKALLKNADRIGAAEVEVVQAMVDALPSPAKKDAKETASKAKELYNKLSAEQKAQVKNANRIGAAEVEAMIDALPASPTEADLDAVKAAQDAYDSLPDAEKGAVAQASKDKLAAAYDSIAVKAVEAQIAALPDDAAATNADAIRKAQAAYDALGSKKSQVGKSYKDKLDSNAVEAQVDALPTTLTLNDEAAVTAAKKAYDALSADAKKLVSAALLEKLNKAVQTIENLKSGAAVKLSTCTITGVADKTFTGKAVTQKVNVTYNGKAATFKTTYANNKAIGLASVVLEGTGQFTGRVVKNFKINPAKVKPKKPKNKKGRKLLVKWKKAKGGVKYEIQYRMNKKGKKWKKWKKKIVKKKKAVKKCKFVVKKLKKGKKYQVRIRAWKKVGGVKYYSAWSKAKKVKVKK